MIVRTLVCIRGHTHVRALVFMHVFVYVYTCV